MPTLPITDVPIQISQSITQPALLQNTGHSPVYLSNDSSVSESAYGMVLTRGSSCMWPANSILWAVTTPGNSTAVSVLYGAEGASLGQVTASIDGPVDVGNTVDVTGSTSTVTVTDELLVAPFPPSTGFVDLVGLGRYATLLISWNPSGPLVSLGGRMTYEWVLGAASLNRSVGYHRGANDSVGMRNSLVIPVEGDSLRLTWSPTSPNISFLQVLGTTQSLPYSYRAGGIATADEISRDGGSLFSAVIASGQSATYYPVVTAGPAVMTIWTNGNTASGAGVVARFDGAILGQGIFQLNHRITNSFSSVSAPFVIPSAAARVVVTNTSTTDQIVNVGIGMQS